MSFSWFYNKSNRKNSENVAVYQRPNRIQKDWEIIRSPFDIENEVDVVDDTLSNYLNINVEGELGRFSDSDEVSEENDDLNTDHEMEGNKGSNNDAMMDEMDQMNDVKTVERKENKILFKTIDEIIDDLKQSAKNQKIAPKSSAKVKKSKKKRKMLSYKSRKARRFTNRRQIRRTK